MSFDMLAPVMLSSTRCFGGLVQKWKHASKTLGGACDEMKISVFVPSSATKESPAPVIYWLSGLTCNEDNFISKAGAQQAAEEHGVILICPDTSPRGCKIEGDSDSWDFGVGAGFYVDATEKKWSSNYRMYTYVTKELPFVVRRILPMADTSRASIMGHSMGGHGALICALRNPGLYKSVSAFAPICNPMKCPWGLKAFKGYLGTDKTEWLEWDSCELLKTLPARAGGTVTNMLVDQGTADDFLDAGQLQPEALRQAAAAAGDCCQLELRMQDGYNHSYYFIATFIRDHIEHHAKFL